jgi:hypothetical protein
LPVLGAAELLFTILCGTYLEKSKSNASATQRMFRLLAYCAAGGFFGQLIHVGLVIALIGWNLRGSLTALNAGDLGPLALYAILVIAFRQLSVPAKQHRSHTTKEG